MHSFLESLPLLGDAYLAAVLIALLLSLFGMQVLARDEVFIGMSVTQFSTLGIAVGLFAATLWPVGAWEEDHRMLSTSMAVVFAVAGVFAIARLRALLRRETFESISGWLFVLSSAGAILLVAKSPFGLEEVSRLMASTLIGARWLDNALLAALLLFCVIIIAMKRREWFALLFDEEFAAACGVKQHRWQTASALLLGVALGLAIRISGTLYAFGCLILPAMAARAVSREMRSMLWRAPLLAAAGTVTGLVCAYHYDLPPGQVIVAIFALMTLATWSGVTLLKGKSI